MPRPPTIKPRGFASVPIDVVRSPVEVDADAVAFPSATAPPDANLKADDRFPVVLKAWKVLSIRDIPPTALPAPLVSQPSAFVRFPIIPKPFPKILKAGPAPAVNAAHLRTFLCCSSDMELNCLAILAKVSIQGFAAVKPSRRAFRRGPPNSIAKSVTWFLNIFSCDSVVSYRLLASLVRAVFSFQALFERSTASPILSEARAKDFNMLLCRIPVIPSCAKIAFMFTPLSCASLSPLIKDCKATTGFSFQAC